MIIKKNGRKYDADKLEAKKPSKKVVKKKEVVKDVKKSEGK